MRQTHYEQLIKMYGDSRGWANSIIQKMKDEAKGHGYDDIPVAAAIAYLMENRTAIIAEKFHHQLVSRMNPIAQLGDQIVGEVRFEADEFAKPMLKLVLSVIDRSLDRMLAEQSDPYSYGELSNNPAFQNMFEYISDKVMGGAFIVQVVTMYHTLSHERAGKRVYSPTDGLAWKLAHTELRNLKTDDLRLPYESVYIEVPKTARLKVYNNDTGWHRCIGMYITEDTFPLKPHRLDHQTVLPYEHVDGFRSWRIMAVGESKGIIDHGDGLVELDDALTYFRIPLVPGESLEDMVKAAGAEMEETKREAEHLGWRNMDDEWKRLFRWAMNAMLYVTWTEPGENWIGNKEARLLWSRMRKMKGKTAKAKRSKLQKKLNQIDPQKRIILGSKVVVDRNVMREGAPGNGEGTPVSVRTRVSGHWRNQAHGPGRTQRKLIWIEPFWRGPEDGPIVTPTHEMR